MGLTNNQQAIMVFVATVLVALGTTTIAVPSSLPDTWKYAIALVLYFCAALGYALKEALGTSTQTDTSSSSTTTATVVPAATVQSPTAFLRLKRRLIFLQLRK